MREILQQRVYKTRITDLDEPTQQLRTERAELAHVVIAAAIRQWHRQYVESSDAFLYTFSCSSRHNQMDSNLPNLEATVKVE